MKRQRAKKLANDSIRKFHYNTRSWSRREFREVQTQMVENPEPLGVRSRMKKSSDEQSDLLPIDLIMEILKRLPVKTLGRFLCVSKLWASIIRRRDFMKLFLTESSNRPGGHLFFAFKRDKDCFFFSSGDSGESSLTTYHLTHPSYDYTINSSSLHGLICYGTASASALVVYNTSTRQSLTLSEFGPECFVIKHFLGYDHVDGVYKVLCMTGSRAVFHMAEPKLVLQVLTLGIENEWRVIEDTPTHFPCKTEICINGVLYYDTYVESNLEETAIMSFHVSSENFYLIKGPSDADYLLCGLTTMIRYEGKLAIMSTEISANGSMVLWVLEDAVRHEWLKKVFVLPNSWTSLAPSRRTPSHEFIHLVNFTDAGEAILAPVVLHGPQYYFLYYDPKRNSVRKLTIECSAEDKHKLLGCKRLEPCFLLYLFSTQVESLMFLKNN